MVKLPDFQDLGAAPTVTGARAIGSEDVSPVARVAAAETQTAQNIGKGFGDLAAATGDVQMDRARYQYATAHATALSQVTDLNTEFAHDQDYSTLTDRYQQRIGQIYSDAADKISMPGMKSRFLELSQPAVSEGVAKATGQAFTLQGDSNVAYISQQGDKFINQATQSPHDTALTSKMTDAYGALVDGAQGQGFISQERALAMKQDWAHRYALADGIARADTDPQGVINELRTAPGSPQQIDNRIVQIESNGVATAKSKTSNAYGLGQFEPGTWLPLVRKYHPELAGTSDNDVLDMRADRGLSLEMVGKLREENTQYLQSKGVDPNAGNIYLAHFLGPAGAAAVAKAAPGQPVQDVLTAAVGADSASGMIARNPSILKGQTAGSVAQWASDKMGGVGPGGGHMYDLLRPDQREMLLDHAQNAVQKQTVDDLSSFKGKIDDTQTEAFNTGAVKAPLTQADFIGHYGLQGGPQAYQQYQANVQLGRDTWSVAKLDPQEQNDLLKSYEPQAGDGYAAASQRYTQVATAIQKANKEKADDPGGFAVSRLPSTMGAFQNFAKVQGDPTAQAADKQAAARNFATTTLLEQQRVGILPEQQQILPKAYVDSFNKDISNAASSDDPQKRIGLVARIQQEAKLWGDQWPAVMRQFAPASQPIVKAIAAEADPVAMTRLLSLDPKDNPVKDLKEQNDVKARDVDTNLNSAMQPFKASLVGRQLDRDYPGYYGLAEKLSALYVSRDNMDAATATTKAFNDLIGNRYDFRDTYRIPKNSGVSADDVQLGALAARSQLGQLGAKPPIDDMPGRTNPTDVDLRVLGRNATFVTSPDNSGLNLVHDGKFVTAQGGAPLTLPWSQLSSIAQTAHREALARRGDTWSAHKFAD